MTKWRKNKKAEGYTIEPVAVLMVRATRFVEEVKVEMRFDEE
jgi:hypothetical protein